MTDPGWQFWIDRGGAFTDVVACDAEKADHARRAYFATTATGHQRSDQ